MIRTILLLLMLTVFTGCSEFALIASGTSVAILASGSSVALSNNVYAKVYSGTDVLTIMYTEKDIKTHTYERIRKTLQKGN